MFGLAFTVCASSLLERSTHFQTWAFLGGLAKRCIHTVQHWWVIYWQWGEKSLFFHHFSYLTRSTGPRACLGRKWVGPSILTILVYSFDQIFHFKRFFETEGIAILTMIISRYKITIKEEPQFIGETFEQRKNRVLNCRAEMTLTWAFLYN